MGGFSYNVEASITTTEVDMLSAKTWNQAPIDRIIRKIGLFVATVANLTKAQLKVGEDIVLEWDFPDGTAPAGDQSMRAVYINVPANKKMSFLVTNTSATNTMLEMDLVT